jgi:two-component system repressor protein LuxO
MAISSVSVAPAGGNDAGLSGGERTMGRSVLLIEDSLAQAAAYSAYLKRAGYAVEHASDGEHAIAVLDERPPDNVLLDLILPGIQGIVVLRHMRSRGSTQPVIVITERASVDIAVSAMKEGADDFVAKPFGAERISVTVENALRERDLSDVVQIYPENYERKSFHGFVGASGVMQSAYRLIESAAKSTATIFITGESGTGKELCAAAVHSESKRANRPFIAINCAAIPTSLMESEIFGHVKGAFTGAVCDRDGAAMQADGGTLFFDEICDMDTDLQAKLLRFVQTGFLRPVGSSEEIKVDVRFICATNRDPVDEVKNGRFREDLYYRLHVVPVELPPLRDRKEDIVAVARHLLLSISAQEGKAFKTFSPEAENILRGYAWPGNVRQLENIIRSVVVLNGGNVVTPAMLPAQVKRSSAGLVVESSPEVDGADEQSVRSLREIEKESIENAIDACHGNVPKAAALLGVSPSTLYRKRQAWSRD